MKNQINDADYILDKVRDAFKAAFAVDPESVSMETTANNISLWDSVGHLTLARSLEETFEITLDVDDLMEMDSVREIVRIISRSYTKA